MDIHEYQAKQLISKFGVDVPVGEVIYQPHEAITVVSWLNEEEIVVKAQIHAGGRGKAGGITLCKNQQEVISEVDRMLGMKIVTAQTGPEGKIVNRVYLEKAFNIKKELYFCITIDRETGGNTIVVSKKGGVDIEEVAEKNPEEIYKVKLDPGNKLLTHHARTISYELGLSGAIAKKAQKNFIALYEAFIALDASLIEVNPLAITDEGDVVAADCKASFDDNALYRQRQVAGMKDDNEYDPLELEAARHDLNYVKLDGNIGLMVNGAGLAMATMDLIKQSGGEPANFLDVGGTADAKRVETAFNLILEDEKVKAILVNIFGGIVRCDRVANGIVDAYKNLGDKINVPIIVRLEGTNSEEAKKIIDNSGLKIYSAIEFKEVTTRIKQVLS